MSKFFVFALTICLLLGCQSVTTLDVQSTDTPSTNEFTESEVTPTLESGNTVEIATIAFATAMPTVTIDFPDYLPREIPAANSVLSLEEYQQLAPSTNWGMESPGICVSIEANPLMEPGDFMDTETFLNRISLMVDGNPIHERASVFHWEVPGFEKKDPETGELIWKAPDGFPAGICYEADLGVGEHMVTVLIEKTSGQEESFTWSFLITQ